MSCHTTILANQRILYGRLAGPFMNKGNTNDMDYYEELMISILFLSECTMKFAMNFKLHFWKWILSWNVLQVFVIMVMYEKEAFKYGYVYLLNGGAGSIPWLWSSNA